MTRRILPNCCEDWIIENGGFYPEGKEFKCLPCGHSWRKEASGRFAEGATATAYVMAEAASGFRYLAPESGPEPALKRCCSKYLVRFGPRAPKPLEGFECPVCGTAWRMERRNGTMPPKDVYVNEESGEAFTLERNPVADYLLPMQ